MMKIVLATSFSGLGGTETATLRLGRLLAAHGHEVVLAASDGPLRQDAEAAGMRWLPMDFYGSRAAYLRTAWEFARMLRRERPDIVHCQMARIVPACALAARFAGVSCRVFYHARGLRPETYPKIARLFDRLGVYIIGNCRHEQQKLIRYGFPAGRTAYTYNALPPYPVEVPPKSGRNDVVLGTLSRLDRVRAVHLTLPVLRRLLDQGLDVRLRIAGQGEEEAALRRQTEDLGLAGRVEFLGAVRDLAHYFSETDILLNTLDCPGDHGAGVGNNILEAGLFQTAVASYDVAGISEMVSDRETGRCLPWRDEDVFTDAVAELVRQPALRAQYGSALRQRVLALCNDEAVYHGTLAAYRM